MSASTLAYLIVVVSCVACVVHVESTGILAPDRIVRTAINLLLEKCDGAVASVDELFEPNKGKRSGAGDALARVTGGVSDGSVPTELATSATATEVEDQPGK